MSQNCDTDRPKENILKARGFEWLSRWSWGLCLFWAPFHRVTKGAWPSGSSFTTPASAWSIPTWQPTRRSTRGGTRTTKTFVPECSSVRSTRACPLSPSASTSESGLPPSPACRAARSKCAFRAACRAARSKPRALCFIREGTEGGLPPPERELSANSRLCRDYTSWKFLVSPLNHLASLSNFRRHHLFLENV